MNRMLFSILNDITRFFIRYAPIGCIIAIAVTLSFLWYEGFWKLKYLQQAYEKYSVQKKIMGRAGCIFLLVLYGYIVIGITILSRNENGIRRASFELFRTFQNTFFARKQIYENVIMFVPYGILVYNFSSVFHRLGICLLLGAGSSFVIETVQWITKTGYFEVDDILTNTIGMVLGYVLCRGSMKIFL